MPEVFGFYCYSVAVGSLFYVDGLIGVSAIRCQMAKGILCFLCLCRFRESVISYCTVVPSMSFIPTLAEMLHCGVVLVHHSYVIYSTGLCR